MRLALVVLLLPVACGPLEVPAVDAAAQAEISTTRERCTVSTLQPGWECCDDGQVVCESRGPMICRAHLLVPMTHEDCLADMNDPRRPELRLYDGAFCKLDASGNYNWCVVPKRQE